MFDTSFNQAVLYYVYMGLIMICYLYFMGRLTFLSLRAFAGRKDSKQCLKLEAVEYFPNVFSKAIVANGYTQWFVCDILCKSDAYIFMFGVTGLLSRAFWIAANGLFVTKVKIDCYPCDVDPAYMSHADYCQAVNKSVETTHPYSCSNGLGFNAPFDGNNCAWYYSCLSLTPDWKLIALAPALYQSYGKVMQWAMSLFVKKFIVLCSKKDMRHGVYGCLYMVFILFIGLMPPLVKCILDLTSNIYLYETPNPVVNIVLQFLNIFTVVLTIHWCMIVTYTVLAAFISLQSLLPYGHLRNSQYVNVKDIDSFHELLYVTNKHKKMNKIAISSSDSDFAYTAFV